LTLLEVVWRKKKLDVAGIVSSLAWHISAEQRGRLCLWWSQWPETCTTCCRSREHVGWCSYHTDAI